MFYEVRESDWVLFNEMLPKWQEAYIGRLLQGYVELLSSPMAPSERFWELEARIQSDKYKDGVEIVGLSRFGLSYHICQLVSCGAITIDDLDRFSGDLIESVRSELESQKSLRRF